MQINTASRQNDLEHLKDQMQRGLTTVDEANVQKVLNERLLVVTKLPREVRKALNTAVKTGQLGHLRKEGSKPEVYFNPTFERLAVSERNERERKAKEIASKIYTYNVYEVR